MIISSRKNVLPKRGSERTSEQGGVIEVPETAGQDRRLQRTVEQHLDVSVAVDKNVLQERISERMHDKLSRKYLQWGFMLWRYWMILCLLKCDDAVHVFC